MVDENNHVVRAVDTALERGLPELQKITGLPVVFGGVVNPGGHGPPQMTISRLSGTYGASLRLLSVVSGRGLGGAAMARRAPCRVSDYASTAGITHDYDHVVVHAEHLTSILAHPIVVGGAVRGVMYAAHREEAPLGDVALHNAGIVVARAQQYAEQFLERCTSTTARTPERWKPTAQAALDDLVLLARESSDPELRRRLASIHRGLCHEELPTDSVAGAVLLAPREIETLRCVARGSSNAEIAEELGLTVDTVKSYLRNAMRRLDVRNRAKAVLAARALGLL